VTEHGILLPEWPHGVQQPGREWLPEGGATFGIWNDWLNRTVKLGDGTANRGDDGNGRPGHILEIRDM
jgi:hypothetical protein